MPKILVAFDGSDGALGALIALSHWSLAGAEVTLLTLHDAEVWPKPRNARLLDTARRVLSRLGARVELAEAEGDPAREILALARRNEADLIVVGSRKRPALAQALLGSVTADVLKDATCPVLIGRLNLALERIVALIETCEDLDALRAVWPNLPLPAGPDVTLAGLPTPIPEAKLPPALRHQAPHVLPQVAALAEDTRLQQLLSEGAAFLEKQEHHAVSLMLPPSEDDVAEVLGLDERVAPELIVLRKPSRDALRQLVARSRASILVIP